MLRIGGRAPLQDRESGRSVGCHQRNKVLGEGSAAFGPFDSINHEATMKRITLLGIVFMTGFLAAPAWRDRLVQWG